MREKRGRKRKCVSIKTLWRFVSNASAFYLKRKCVFRKVLTIVAIVLLC